MAEPGAEPVSRVVAHRAHLGRRPERVGYPFGGALVVGSEADSHMAVVENGVVGAISLFDLVQRLRSEEHTSELQSLMSISYAVLCLKKKKIYYNMLSDDNKFNIIIRNTCIIF